MATQAMGQRGALRQNRRMAVPLLNSAFALAKIQPPRARVGLVERPALERALGKALLEHRLTLLLAPAGYGKTAALTRQIRQLPEGCALAWLSADEDDQLERFLACLTAALEPHDLPWRVAPDALATLALVEHGLREVATVIVNALTAAEVARGLIVIDDAHRIADPRVFELLQAMLDHWPAQWSLVMASRVEPPLPLARLRAAGDLAEFRQGDLRFDASEVAALVAACTVPARSGADPGELLRRTQGWAAGLRLSLSTPTALAEQHVNGAVQRHLFDYLAAEVFDDMPADLRDFLLRCSVLPELTAARCAQVSGMPQAARLLDEVERRGLFVSTIDAQEMTLRLHDLMREFLEDRLRRDHADEIPLLLRRAAQSEPDLARAVGYLVRAGAWDEAAQALAQRGPALLAVGEGPALERMLALFPPAEFTPRPDLQLLRGLAAFLYYDWDTLLVAMQHAAEGFAQAGRAEDAALARAYACTGLHHTGHRAQATQALAELRQATLGHRVRAVVSYVSAWDAFSNERSEDVATHVSQMLDALDQVPDPRLWHQCANLSLFIGLPGMTPLLLRFADGVMRVAGDVPSPLRAGVMHVRTCLALAAGRIEEAWHWLQLADDECHWLGMPRLLLTDNGFAHVLLHALRGEREAAHAHAAVGEEDMARRGALSHRRVHETDLLIAHSRASWLLGDEPALRAIDAALQRAANPFEWSTAQRCRALSRSFIALLDGELDSACQLLEPLVDKVERHMFFPATQARFMLADVQQRLGRLDAAAATLRPWLVDASGSGEIGGALLAGAAMLGRLAALDWGGCLASSEQALLKRLQRLSQDAVVPAAAGVAALQGEGRRGPAAGAVQSSHADALAGLTEREREVLQRIAAGDSNKLIARAFDLSPHTVKRHVANILGKLGVATRGQAAARWREA